MQIGDYESIWLLLVESHRGDYWAPNCLFLITKYERFQFVLFVDDTNIFCSGEKFTAAFGAEVKIGFDANKLLSNSNKTKPMLFENCQINRQVANMLDNVIIERINENSYQTITVK